jgi:putative transposase
VVRHVQDRLCVSQRRACKVLDISRSTQRYQGRQDTDELQRLVARMHELVRAYPRYGYRFIGAKLRQEGWHVNAKKIYRLWRREGFKVPRKTRKKRRLGHSGNSCVRRRAERPDHVWTWDFINDRTTTGQPLKWFAITDEFTRECLALEVDRGITADRVLDVLTNLFLTRGVPRHIRSDNGPEFIATAIRHHGEQVGLEMLYIEPGSPWENGFAESFFSRLRDELLNCEEFANLAEARWFARRRLEEHNHERPHSSLGYQTPSAFAAACAASAPAAPALQQHTRRQDEAEETLLPVPQPILS